MSLATVKGNVEIAYLGTEYIADYTYSAGDIEVTAIRYDDGSQDGRPADEHSPFYGTIQKLANEAAWKDVHAMTADARSNYGAY